MILVPPVQSRSECISLKTWNCDELQPSNLLRINMKINIQIYPGDSLFDYYVTHVWFFCHSRSPLISIPSHKGSTPLPQGVVLCRIYGSYPGTTRLGVCGAGDPPIHQTSTGGREPPCPLRNSAFLNVVILRHVNQLEMVSCHLAAVASG